MRCRLMRTPITTIRICRAQRPSLQHSGRDLGRLVSVLKQLETCLKEIETFSGELRADLVTKCTGSIGVTAADGIAKATDPKSIGLPRTRPALCHMGTLNGHLLSLYPGGDPHEPPRIMRASYTQGQSNAVGDP